MKLQTFGGELPRLEPHLLPDSNGQQARNVKLDRNTLTPFAVPLSRATTVKAGTVRSIYRFLQSLDSDQQYWFHWLNDTDVVRGFVAADTLERTFYTEAGQVPRVTDASIATAGADMPTAWWDLGIPGPVSAALLTVTGSSTGTPNDVLVAYSFLNARGEEGPISPASNIITLYPAQTLNVQNMEGNPGGYWNVTGKRLYISQTDENGYTAYRFWVDVAIGSSTYSSTVNLDTLGEEAPSPSPLKPPATLTSLNVHPNGFLVGLADNKFCRSDVYKGYAWPREFQEPIVGDPVACCVVGQSTVIGTRLGCYLANGSDPLGQSVENLKQGQPCVSKRSMRLTSIGVVYACPDGLVAVDAGGGSELVTRGLFTRDQWQALKPESMMAVVHNGLYFCWYDTGTVKSGFVLDFNEGVGIVHLDFHATAAYSDPRRDALYVMQESDPVIYKWDAGATAITMTWRSKDWHFDRPSWIGAARIVGDLSAGPVTFELYVDGVLWRSRTITHNKPFRIKPKRASKVSFRVLGVASIKQIVFGPTIDDVAAG